MPLSSWILYLVLGRVVLRLKYSCLGWASITRSTVHFLQTGKKDHNEAALFEAAQQSSVPVTLQPLKTI